MSISIAIPDSSLSDETTQLNKSRKIAQIARACAIFRVNTIYIYDHKGSDQDRMLFVNILKYLETPQFLRKRLFPKLNELKYAGVLHPLKIPSHITPANPKKVTDGDIREGIIISKRGKKFVDVGINVLLPFFEKKEIGKRVTIQFRKGYPDFSFKEINKEDASKYWGYMVKERGRLGDFLNSWKGKIILTSRKAKNITHSQAIEYQKTDESILVVFGSVDKGIHDILGGKISKIQNSKTLNFFPDQATETIRLEEAILGTLSILKIP